MTSTYSLHDVEGNTLWEGLPQATGVSLVLGPVQPCVISVLGVTPSDDPTGSTYLFALSATTALRLGDTYGLTTEQVAEMHYSISQQQKSANKENS